MNTPLYDQDALAVRRLERSRRPGTFRDEDRADDAPLFAEPAT